MSGVGREFDKYHRSGAYHWHQTDPAGDNPQFNPPLLARYRVMADAVPGATRMLLDAGCGDGYLLYRITRIRPSAQLFGIDALEAALKLARSQLVAHQCSAFLQTASVCAMPFHGALFDTVCMADIIEHLPEPEQALAEARRVLKKDGLLLLSTPNRQPEGCWDRLHVREFSPEELAEVCKKHFTRVTIKACWPMRLFRKWQQGGRLRQLINFMARAGCNPFAWQTERPSGAYGQLIAVCAP